MTAAQQQQAAKNFAAYWKGKGYEKGESQSFLAVASCGMSMAWNSRSSSSQFEEQVHLDHTSFIDGAIPVHPCAD